MTAAFQCRRRQRRPPLLARLVVSLVTLVVLTASCSGSDADSASDPLAGPTGTAVSREADDAASAPATTSPTPAPASTSASAETTPSTTAAVNAEPHYPRSVTVGDGVVTIERQPVRIAALSTDVAEVVLALVAPERVIAVPEANANPAIGSQPKVAASVPHHVALGDTIDEQLLDRWGVDLVVISPNHRQEAQLAGELADSGISVLTMPNSWDTLIQAQENVLLIGNALGAERAAAQIVADMSQRTERVAERIAESAEPPAVLILTNVAGVPFLIGRGVSTSDLVHRAGGANVADRMGVELAISPVAADQIAAAAPDRILLIDGLGTGRASFDRLLDNEVLTGVPAIVDDQVLVLPARISFGVAHTLVDGLEAIADWLHPG